MRTYIPAIMDDLLFNFNFFFFSVYTFKASINLVFSSVKKTQFELLTHKIHQFLSI